MAPVMSLGRVVQVKHDLRSLEYAHPVWPKSAISPVKWTRRAPVFDQGNVGSCTGNAAAGLIGTDSKDRKGLTSVVVTAAEAAATHGVFKAGTYQVSENLALNVYALSTILDTYPGTYPAEDTGSDGLAAAKSLEAIGQADKYLHAFSIAALDTALQSGPVMVGSDWLNSMFDPTADGYIQVDRTSGVAGGHEYIIDELLANGDYGMQNSWSDTWGKAGRAFLKRADVEWLLSQQGDVTVPHLLGGAAPVPPTPPVPPAPIVDENLTAFFTDPKIRSWLASRHVGSNKYAATAVTKLGQAEGLL